MFCKNCGKQLDDHVQVCPYCNIPTSTSYRQMSAQPWVVPTGLEADEVSTEEMEAEWSRVIAEYEPDEAEDNGIYAASFEADHIFDTDSDGGSSASHSVLKPILIVLAVIAILAAICFCAKLLLDRRAAALAESNPVVSYTPEEDEPADAAQEVQALPGTDSSASAALLSQDDCQTLVEQTFELFAQYHATNDNAVTFLIYGSRDVNTNTLDDYQGMVMVNNATGSLSILSGMEGYTVPAELAPAADEEELIALTMYVSGVDYALYFWKDLDTSAGTYPAIPLGGEVSYIRDANEDYAKVIYQDQVGYVRKDYISETKPVIDEEVKYDMYVTAAAIALRQYPSDSSAILSALPMGTKLGYIMTMPLNDDYCKVSYNGQILYTCLADLSRTEPSEEALDEAADEISETLSQLQSAVVTLPDPEEETAETAEDDGADASETTGERITPIAVTASSYLTESDGTVYSADLIMDDDGSTCWTEGADGDGLGETLTFTIEEGTKLTAIEIINGYCSSEAVFFKNAAPTQLEITTGGKTATVDLTRCSDDYATAAAAMTCPLSDTLTSDGTVTVRIIAVRSGNTYSDTCISELWFIG